MAKLILDLDGERITPSAARLALNIATTTWSEPHQKWMYGEEFVWPHWQIDVSVDEYSGDFLHVSPSLLYLLPRPMQLPPLEAMAGVSFADLENQRCEAWIGNDSPMIEQNALNFGEWLGDGSIEIEWSGKYQAGRERTLSPFKLSGPVLFQGITLQVKEESDAAKLLAAAWPGLDQADLVPNWGEWIRYGAEIEESRRHRRPATFTRR